MFKEAGNLAKAEEHYDEAARLSPGDPDLALQRGHFYTLAGRLPEAERAYFRAVELRPEWWEPVESIASLLRTARDTVPTRQGGGSAEERRLAEGGRAARFAWLSPELVARHPQDLVRDYGEEIEFRRGRRERTLWGTQDVLRGIEAIRGYCISKQVVTEMEILLDDRVIYATDQIVGSELRKERTPGTARKYVFNAWCDFSSYPFGRYSLEVRCRGQDRAVSSRREWVVIAEPFDPADHPDSDALVRIAPGDPRSIDDQVNAQPSVVRPAQRDVDRMTPRSILAMRTDQLGDVVASIPAFRRLRELFPAARLVGLFAPTNVDFARTLGIFDETLVVDFPDDMVHERRLLSLEDQEALRERLLPYRFDVAIDFAQSNLSRPLLRLTGARFQYGFGFGDHPWLAARFELDALDRVNRHDMFPHSRKLTALVETLGVLLRSEAPVIRRPDLDRGRLGGFGLGATDRYAVLHTGARIVFSRWPYYVELSKLIVERTDLKVVILGEEIARAGLPPDLAASDRFQLVDRRLDFDDLDALISFCTVYVGNDTGPKHLASLRGVNTISLHSSRTNWTEWGQEASGIVISRKVPCAGCSIFHNAEECGKGWVCITRIRPEEVYEQVSRFV